MPEQTETEQLLQWSRELLPPADHNLICRVIREKRARLIACPSEPVHGSSGCYGEPENPCLSIHRRSENIEFRAHHMRLHVSGDSQ